MKPLKIAGICVGAFVVALFVGYIPWVVQLDRYESDIRPKIEDRVAREDPATVTVPEEAVVTTTEVVEVAPEEPESSDFASDFDSITVGDSEESVIDKLGEPDERATVGEALSEQGAPPELSEVAEAAGIAGEENLWWEDDGMQYLLSIKDGEVSDKGDPVSCDIAVNAC